MISSLLVSLFAGAGIIIALMFTMGQNISEVLGSPFGQPVGQMLYNSLGKRGAIALLFFLFLGFIFNCTNIMFAASRDLFAFCRDGGFSMQYLPSSIDELASTCALCGRLLFGLTDHWIADASQCHCHLIHLQHSNYRYLLWLYGTDHFKTYLA